MSSGMTLVFARPDHSFFIHSFGLCNIFFFAVIDFILKKIFSNVKVGGGKYFNSTSKLSTEEPLLGDHPFCQISVVLKEGWSLKRGVK